MKRRTVIAIGALSTLAVVGVLAYRASKLTFKATIEPLPDDVRREMTNVSWYENCPVSLDNLALITTSYWTKSGFPGTGEIIVHRDQAEKVVQIFKDLFEMKFPIERMERIVKYNGEDPKSMAANNTSAFRCSPLERTKFNERGTWSEHASGDAIDINPLYNPYVKGSVIQPPEGEPYVDRDQSHPYMVTPSVVSAFARQGWKWGGNWKSAKDWQHFSVGGR